MTFVVPNGQADPLGSATIQLVERVRAKHNEWRDGRVTEFVNCSVQPMSSSESDQGLTTEAKWALFVPGGDFPEQTDNVVRWAGHELSVDGRLQTWYDDLTGASLYVHGALKAWEA